MTTRRTLAIAGFMILTLPLTESAHGQQLAAGRDYCRSGIHAAIAREHRLFRSVVYGLRKAEEAGVSEVRHDQEGRAWIKVRPDEWRSAAAGFEDMVRTDSEIQAEGDTAPRRGIFETRRVLTSRLIPYLTQSLRAFQCQLANICERVYASIHVEYETPVPFTISVPGCRKEESETIPACHVAATQQGKDAEADALGYCNRVSLELLKREAELLKMATEYDAAYRSLFQFVGMFDGFLVKWRQTIAGTLRQAAGIVGLLRRIPCFLSSCDEYPPPSE